MTRFLVAPLVAFALVLACAGGGGRDPRAAMAWQVLAVLAAGIVLARYWRPSVPAVLLALLAVSGFVAALHAAVPHASLVQALAWTCAVLPACSLAAAARRAGARPALRAALLLSSIGVIALQVMAGLGWPLLGRAGASPGQRPLGTFMDPNHLVETLVAVAIANASLAGLAGRARAHLGVTIACAIGVLASGSRIGPLALLGLVVGESLRRGIGRHVPRRVRLALVAGSLVLLVVAGVVIAQRRNDVDAWTRPTIWRAAAAAALERPALGLGPGGFTQRWRAYNPPVERGLGRFAKLATTPHGEWLRVPIELGAAGVLLALALGVALARRIGLRELLPVGLAAAPLLLVHDVFHCPAALAWLATACAVPWIESAPQQDVAFVPAGSQLARGLVVAMALGVVVRVQLAQASRERGPAGLGLALAMDAADPESLRALAAALAPEGRALEVLDLRAEGVLAEAERRAPGSFDVALDQARLAVRELRDLAPDEATRALVERGYARALALAPRSEALHVEAAAALLSSGDAPAAARLLWRALDLEPNDARARALQALALHRTGREGQAAAQAAAMSRLLALANDAALSHYERRLVTVEEALVDAVRREVPGTW